MFGRHKKQDRSAGQITFDPETQEAVIRSSICTGEKTAGFLSRTDGRFTEIMLIRTPEDEKRFKEMCRQESVRTIY
ncbi:MAG: aspartate dehydrogenase [Clostridia bacterium]|nr:aspartate dehydrogenase [Clostridia bacterium]